MFSAKKSLEYVLWYFGEKKNSNFLFNCEIDKNGQCQRDWKYVNYTPKKLVASIIFIQFFHVWYKLRKGMIIQKWKEQSIIGIVHAEFCSLLLRFAFIQHVWKDHNEQSRTYLYVIWLVKWSEDYRVYKYSFTRGNIEMYFQHEYLKKT